MNTFEHNLTQFNSVEEVLPVCFSQEYSRPAPPSATTLVSYTVSSARSPVCLLSQENGEEISKQKSTARFIDNIFL